MHGSGLDYAQKLPKVIFMCNQFKLRGTHTVREVFGLHVISVNLIFLGNLLNLAIVAA